MSQVYGTPRRPAHTVVRTDRHGQAISIGVPLPKSKAILYTGPPGLGKTRELDKARKLADDRGWTTISVRASKDDPLENVLTRAIRDDLDKLRERYGHGPVRNLRKTVRDLTARTRSVQRGIEAKLTAFGFLTAIYKKQWDATAHEQIGTTLNDFGDRLGELAESNGRPVLLTIDNIDVASANDLAGLNELAIHLEKRGRPVWLVTAGGAMAPSMLMKASRRMSGIATTVTNQFDIREVGPMGNHELWAALTVPLRANEVQYDLEAIDQLVKAANGDPTRLRSLADAALAYAERDSGITTDVATAAIEHVKHDYAKEYQDYWNNSADPEKAGRDPQKNLLVKVAAQGPNGLPMPAEYEAAGPGRWQDIDEARQLLVARGLLREHEGGVVTFADPAFQDWINDYVGQTPAAAGPPELLQALARSARKGAEIAPVHPTGDQAALASQVFGPSDDPVHRIDRTDDQGLPISLDVLPPRGTSVLFTGPPGMGTSHELDKVQVLAKRQDWMSFRVDASTREMLGFRVVRSINENMEKFRDRYGQAEAAKLNKLAGELALRTRRALTEIQLAAGIPGVGEIRVGRRADDAAKSQVGSTLNELADYLGTLAEANHEPILLMVDNLDCANDHDLEDMSKLSARLQERGQPMFLIAAGGDQAPTELMAASGGESGIETKVTHRFDVRKVGALSDNELRPALTVPLQEARIPAEPEAVDALVKAANGNPSRLRTLGTTALELTDRLTGVTAEVAKAAMAQLNIRSRLLYEGAWYNCKPEQKELLAKAAARGAQGLPMRAEIGTDNWAPDNAAQKLISRGLLQQNGRTVTVADPGMLDWIQTRMGQSAANAGVAQPIGRAPQQPQLTDGGRPKRDRHTGHERTGGRPSQANR